MRLLSCLLACAMSLAMTATAADAPHPILLQPDRVWTAEGDAAHAGWVVLVRNGAIEAVGDPASVQVPADAQRIALPGTTLTPGLMDLHSHLFLHPYNETLWNDQVLKEPEAERVLRAAGRLHHAARPRH